MLRRLGALALPLGLLSALAVGACGSDDGQESGAQLTPPPLSSATSVPATTAATTATTTTTTTSTTPATTTATGTTQAAAPPATGGATTTQPSGGAPAGCAPLHGGFIRDVRATDCDVARTVASAWFQAVDDGAAPDDPIEAAGYSCSGSLAGERASVTCRGDGGTVAFTASP